MTGLTVPEGQVGSEWKVLECICLGLESGDLTSHATALLSAEDFDYGELMEQAMRHGLFPLLVHEIEKTLRPFAVKRIPWFAFSAPHYLDVNRHRNKQLTLEAIRVVDALTQAEIPVVCSKGIHFQHLLYADPGARLMGDIDMMILPGDRDRVQGLLQGLGYVVGRYNFVSRRIEDLPRQDQLLYQLNPDHLPRLVRYSEHLGVPFLKVDVANSLTWTGSPWHVPMDVVLGDRAWITIGRPDDASPKGLPVLPIPYAYLFTALHLFREAWFERTAVTGKPRFSQFCDLIRLWNAHRSDLRVQLPGLIERYGIAGPLAWVCAHTDRIFNSCMTEELGLCEQATDSWLHSARATNGGRLAWSGTMRERLCRKTGPQFWSVEEEKAPDELTA